jgi:type I restriction enzyme, R subunit
MFSQKSYKSQFRQFDEKGGRGKMYQLFGAEMNNIINELNEVLAA